MRLWPIVGGLVLLMVANGAPVLGKKAFGAHASWPADFGLLFLDGRPVFGPSKTIRGLVLSIAASSAAAALLGLPWRVGALGGAAAMAGDLASSFIKRRLNLPSQSMAVGLDQVPEALLPLLVWKQTLGLDSLDIAVGAALFCIGELALSRVLYALNIREKPY
ncbi:CDP-archaeol synthase [Methylocapsa palsarum]|uniref:CDP-2,3-bis-(O-geranylgeranyl)-sn-glycerol synthase n=1 Tax=Methylocapsa palsarum TaxID=1612308 RepID=A0A1I3YQ11_9HYPH|nr:CDP-archaeol synthase [Methylocapsa palsarum]SFK33958.1 CDP-2,3-bis-(O-geranylgeranyl)-sn-glycerol synthase [Methylocapsa palsarum]